MYKKPGGVVGVEGGVLKGLEAASGDTPQTPLCRRAVRERQIIIVSPVPVPHEREPIV